MSMLRYDHTKIAESLVNYSEVYLLKILAGKQDIKNSVITSDSLKNIYYITAAWKYLREGFCTEDNIIEALAQYPSDHFIVYGVSGDSFKLPLHDAVSYVINIMCQPILTPAEENEFKAVLTLAGKAGPLSVSNSAAAS